MFWGLSDTEHRVILEEAIYLWFETARETLRVPIEGKSN